MRWTQQKSMMYGSIFFVAEIRCRITRDLRLCEGIDRWPGSLTTNHSTIFEALAVNTSESDKFDPIEVGKRQELNSGSRWYRWEPHVHAPGTVLNDQFRGPDKWESYLKALETATPAIRAIGVTDYYSTESYERVCEAKQQGRLSGCDLIFPNIEMRLGTERALWRIKAVHARERRP